MRAITAIFATTASIALASPVFEGGSESKQVMVTFDVSSLWSGIKYTLFGRDYRLDYVSGFTSLNEPGELYAEARFIRGGGPPPEAQFRRGVPDAPRIYETEEEVEVNRGPIRRAASALSEHTERHWAKYLASGLAIYAVDQVSDGDKGDGGVVITGDGNCLSCGQATGDDSTNADSRQGDSAQR